MTKESVNEIISLMKFLLEMLVDFENFIDLSVSAKALVLKK